MKDGEKVSFIIISVSLSCILGFLPQRNCGVDNSGTDIVKEGVANIETYPWLGILFYPIGTDDLMKTTIVLITKRMALASALDIDKYPKDNFRALARAVLGRNCSGPSVGVKDYTYHPDFSKDSYSSLAIVQLNTMFTQLVIRPICAPPKLLTNPQVYAMSLSHDCTSSMVRVYKMTIVESSECQAYYRRFNLDISSLWPTHYACARASYGGHCVWLGGTVLVSRLNKQWRLLGIGVNGPGCEAPARFLDYGMYHGWVKQSLARMGRPAITRMGPDLIILRRTMDTVQRFGTCDKEETKMEIFTDTTSFKQDSDGGSGYVSYNLSLTTDVDYSCIVLRVYSKLTVWDTPRISLRRWCRNPLPICYDFTMLKIEFSVDIQFTTNVEYKVSAYGREIKFIDVRQYRAITNKIFYDNFIVPQTLWNSDAIKNFVTSKPNRNLSFEALPHISNITGFVEKNIPDLLENSFG